MVLRGGCPGRLPRTSTVSFTVSGNMVSKEIKGLDFEIKSSSGHHSLTQVSVLSAIFPYLRVLTVDIAMGPLPLAGGRIGWSRGKRGGMDGTATLGAAPRPGFQAHESARALRANIASRRAFYAVFQTRTAAGDAAARRVSPSSRRPTKSPSATRTAATWAKKTVW